MKMKVDPQDLNEAVFLRVCSCLYCHCCKFSAGSLMRHDTGEQHQKSHVNAVFRWWDVAKNKVQVLCYCT